MPPCPSPASGYARPAGRALAESGPEPGLAHPPEVDLYSADEGYRDLVPVLPHVIGRRRDVAFLPADAEVCGHPLDHRPRVVAQVTAGTAEQCDPRHASRHDAGRTESAARRAARRSAPCRTRAGHIRAGRSAAGQDAAGGAAATAGPVEAPGPPAPPAAVPAVPA